MILLACSILIPVAWMLFRPRRAEAYAETHYRILPAASFLYRAIPEVYWDCPWRVTRGDRLPLALLIKDAHRFPITVEKIEVVIRAGSESRTLEFGREMSTELAFPLIVRNPFFYTVIEIDLPEEIRGPLEITPRLTATVGDKRRTFGVTSHPGFAPDPLHVYVAEAPLPLFEGWTYAETHTHSWHTSSQIEFGAPPALITRMARTIGLRWVFITDHSFDLMTPPGRWFGEDPDAICWKQLEREIKEANAASPDVTLFRGEEVSCGSAEGRNIHLLVYGVPERIPGQGDSAKRWRWWKNAPDLTLPEVIARVRRHGGLAFASHPMTPVKPIERRILNRGSWTDADLHQDLDGWEIWNTEALDHFEEAREGWVRQLLAGARAPVIAGSDAHGDFNRTRATSLPFFRVIECFREAFGKPRTALETPHGTEEEMFAALRSGRAVMTNGPIATLEATTLDGKHASLGETMPATDVCLHIRARSTEEFGHLRRVSLIIGEIGGAEAPIHLGEEIGFEAEFHTPMAFTRPVYVRVEAEAERDGLVTYALTNPIWVEPTDRW